MISPPFTPFTRFFSVKPSLILWVQQVYYIIDQSIKILKWVGFDTKSFARNLQQSPSVTLLSFFLSWDLIPHQYFFSSLKSIYFRPNHVGEKQRSSSKNSKPSKPWKSGDAELRRLSGDQAELPVIWVNKWLGLFSRIFKIRDIGINESKVCCWNRAYDA